MSPKQGKRDELTELQLLRLGSPGKPRQVEVARRMRTILGRAISKGHMSLFESGAAQVSPEFRRAYARALGVPAREVERRYWQTRESYARALAREAREHLTTY